MRLIIAGSRGLYVAAVDMHHIVERAGFKPTEIVSGTARGIDQAGENYAKIYEIPTKKFPADWDRYGKAAGYIRNEDMATYADALLAIWDGESRGTKNMIDLMEKAGKPVYVYAP